MPSDRTWPGGIGVGTEVDDLWGLGDLRNAGAWADMVTIGGADGGIREGRFSSEDGR